jgi:hypothetical protein
MGPERRGRADQGQNEANPAGEEPRTEPKPKVKSFEISKRLVFEAWEKVRANNGAPGVDAVGVAEFAARERDNLYLLWNRMSSGSYFPGPVRAVEIPKDHGRGGSGSSACRTRPTGWPRPRQRCCWRRSWSRSSTRTATVIVLGVRPMTRWP